MLRNAVRAHGICQVKAMQVGVNVPYRQYIVISLALGRGVVSALG